ALTRAAPSTGLKKRVSKFKFFGVNESGAEFGNSSCLPGTLGKDYTWATFICPLLTQSQRPDSTIDTLVGKVLNIFQPRIPIMMERIIPTSMTGSVDATYAQGLKTYADYITGKGAYAIIDPHNFARYYGKVIDDYSGFQALKTLASLDALNSKVIFDCNNEPHDMGSASVPKLMQACIDGIRAAGATSQYIFVEG
ncbi:glycoside hydrolase superfamily, partial [Hyaloscypha finlandica]